MSIIVALITVGIILLGGNVLIDFLMDFLNRKLPTKPSSVHEEPKKEMTLDINRSHRDFMKVQRGELSEREFKRRMKGSYYMVEVSKELKHEDIYK